MGDWPLAGDLGSFVGKAGSAGIGRLRDWELGNSLREGSDGSGDIGVSAGRFGKAAREERLGRGGRLGKDIFDRVCEGVRAAAGGAKSEPLLMLLAKALGGD